MTTSDAVLHVSSARTWRGGEQQVASLYAQLGALDVPQALACVAGSELERRARERGFRVVPLRRRGAVDPFFARGVARAAAELGAAVVHAHDPHAHTAAVLAASLFGLRAPVIVHRRVDFPIKRDRFTRWKYDHRAVRRIVCVSGAIAEVLRPAVREPDRRLRVVHSGVDLARFQGVAADGRLHRELGLAPEVPVVGNVAALAAHKGHPTFVAVAAALLDRGLDVRFALVGEGEERGAIEADLRARGLAGKVALTGFRADVPPLLAELAVLLFPSVTEGLGTTLLDAFAAGVPVVSTRAGGIPEVVVDGETGLLAAVSDVPALAAAVERLLRDPALRARLVEGGRRRLQEFTVRRTAERVREVYAEALAEVR
ncbi:MAG: glycosyltransferase family 4 protein [Anaeromyxobacter sp.]